MIRQGAHCAMRTARRHLRSIVAAREFLSDASMIARGGPQAGIGGSTIKQRRLAPSVPGARMEIRGEALHRDLHLSRWIDSNILCAWRGMIWDFQTT
jgi:hypothetical protein